MKHTYWVKQIHLYRDGELSNREQYALKSHLDKCRSCRELQTMVQNTLEPFMDAFSNETTPLSPKDLTGQILSQIPLAGEPPKPWTGRVWPEMVEILFGSRTRNAFQLATILLLATFFVEQVQLTQSIQALEYKLSQKETVLLQARISILPEPIRLRLVQKIQKEGLRHLVPIQADERVGFKLRDFRVPAEIRRLQRFFPEQTPEELQQLLAPYNDDQAFKNWRKP